MILFISGVFFYITPQNTDTDSPGGMKIQYIYNDQHEHLSISADDQTEAQI